MTDPWDPTLYARFAAERRAPFDDLLSLCAPCETAVDLGCGTGALTRELHTALRCTRTVGIDKSPAMLEKAQGAEGLSFESGSIEDWNGPPADLVFANASLQWVADHPTLLPRLRRQVKAGGQLAFQVPANHNHPSHRIARGLAGDTRTIPVLEPTQYADILHDLGANEQRVRLEIYTHEMPSTDDVVTWCAGTVCTPYRGPDFEPFLERYRAALLAELGEHRPYLFHFPRILAWARLP